ncbi:MAG: hypothetical protein ACREPR_07365 [Brasilonema sp.]
MYFALNGNRRSHEARLIREELSLKETRARKANGDRRYVPTVAGSEESNSKFKMIDDEVTLVKVFNFFQEELQFSFDSLYFYQRNLKKFMNILQLTYHFL